jgi:hypothetical protein
MTDAAPAAHTPAVHRGETGVGHDFVRAGACETGHDQHFVPLPGAALASCPSLPAAIPAALSLPAATPAALALARDLEEDLKWALEMKTLSAALGYTDSVHGKHFILDEETVHNRLFILPELQNANYKQSVFNEGDELNMYGVPHV